MTVVEIRRPGLLTTVQDLGRPGVGRWGVSPSGAADRHSFRLANRLVGNDDSAAALEVTLGGLVLVADGPVVVAVTGAPAPVTVDGEDRPAYAPIRLAAGAELRLGNARSGLRVYVGVRGGLDLPPVLGSRSTDTLGHLGPAPLQPGERLPIGPPPARPAPEAGADVTPIRTAELTLRLLPGPRTDWFKAEAVRALAERDFTVTPDCDRVGLRLSGPPLGRAVTGELASEGLVRGALQVPAGGQPVLFLADHPVTGGYPVIGVVADPDVDLAAQARPGSTLRFSLVAGGVGRAGWPTGRR